MGGVRHTGRRSAPRHAEGGTPPNMTSLRRTITWAVVALSLAAAAFGIYLADEDNDEDDINSGAIVLAASVAVLAGTLIYTMAMDDYQVRRQVLGEEAERRDRDDDAGDGPPTSR